MPEGGLLPTLRLRLLVLGALSLVLVLLLAAAGGYLQARTALYEVQAHNLETLATRLAADVDDRVRTRQVLLEQGAANLQLAPQQFERQGSALITRLRYLKGMFNSVLLYDLRGNVIADYPALPGRLGLNVAGQDYFRTTRDSLRPQVSEPVRLRGGLNRTVIVFTAPVFSTEGQLAGVLGASLELYSPEFFGELKNIAIGQGGFLTVHAMRSRLTILHADAGAIMQVAATSDPLLQRALAGRSGYAAVGDSRGVPVLQVYRRLRNVPWLLGVVLPLHEVTQPASLLGRQHLLLVLSALLLLLPLLWWGVRRLLRPLGRLQNQLTVLRRDPHVEVAPLGCRELQRIGHDVAAAFRGRADCEQQLAAREALFSSLGEVSPMGVLVVDAQARLQYLNPAGMRIIGLPAVQAGDRLGRHWLDDIHPDSLPQVAGQWQQLLANGRGFELLCRLRHSDGCLVMAELHFSELAGSGGERRFLGLLSDVSAREEARGKLRAEHERTQLVLGTIGDAVVLANRVDEVEYVNPPALALFGVPASDMLGRLLGVFMNLVSPETGLAVPLRDIERNAAGKPLALDLLSRDMRVQPVLLTLSVMHGHGPLQGCKVVVLRPDGARLHREQPRREASYDVLTGLRNRRGFLTALGEVLDDNRVHYQPHVLAIIDLDYFKAVNDSAGHQGGDLLLQDVARIMQRQVRSGDIIARLGGDEFAILLCHCEQEVAERMLHELLQLIDAHVVYLGERTFRISASIGVTMIQLQDERAQPVLSRADDSCHQAKQRGRNCLVLHAGAL
ncbi:diguanylate cyclase domain-containing protein [Vogesella fluminis]|uniref:diguanylate cyclase domain-containing protein n=1 Tax=Vogesella fluminis TaxID=1069161 RepID=UPI001679C6F4|nr:diguanylate cyclase [Vogesella fluminis]